LSSQNVSTVKFFIVLTYFEYSALSIGIRPDVAS